MLVFVSTKSAPIATAASSGPAAPSPLVIVSFSPFLNDCRISPSRGVAATTRPWKTRRSRSHYSDALLFPSRVAKSLSHSAGCWDELYHPRAEAAGWLRDCGQWNNEFWFSCFGVPSTFSLSIGITLSNDARDIYLSIESILCTVTTFFFLA